MKNTMINGMINGENNTIKGDVKMERNVLVTRLEETIAEAMVNGVAPALVASATKALNIIKTGKINYSNEQIAAVIKGLEKGAELAANVIVDRKNVVQALNKVLKAKKYITIPALVISRNDDEEDTSIISNSAVPTARVFTDVTLLDSVLMPAGPNLFSVITNTSYAPATLDFLTVKFKSEDDLFAMEDEGIWIAHNGRKTVAFKMNYGRGHWELIGPDNAGLLSEEDDNEFTVEEIKNLEGDVRLYKSITFSASGIRNGDNMFKDVTNRDDREEYLDKISNGAWSILKAQIAADVEAGKYSSEEGKDKLMKFILKQMPRFGQLQAGSVNLAPITSWSYIDAPFTTADGQTVDGTGYYRASYVAECFSKITGFTVVPRAVEGMFLQARPDMQKAAYYVLPDDVYEALEEMMVATGLLVKMGSEKNKKKSVLLVDSNVVKLESNFEVDCNFELLEIAQSSAANTSKQMIEKAMFIDPDKTMAWINKLSEEQLTERFVKTFFKEEGYIPTPGEISKGYASDVTLAIAPQYMLQSKAVYRSNLTNFMRSGVNAGDKMKFSIDGANARLTSDISELFCGGMNEILAANKVLKEAKASKDKNRIAKAMKELEAIKDKSKENRIIKYGEIYMPAAEKYMRKNNLTELKIAMIKYPSMGVKELYIAKVVTKAEIKERVQALNVNNHTKKMIYKFFAAAQEGLAILPALEVVMFQCAGLDYDYDGATFVFDQDYVSIVDNGDIHATKMVSEKERLEAVAQAEAIEVEEEMASDKVIS